MEVSRLVRSEDGVVVVEAKEVTENTKRTSCFMIE